MTDDIKSGLCKVIESLGLDFNVWDKEVKEELIGAAIKFFNTRADPDVTELVRYYPDCKSDEVFMMQSIAGEYVLHSQAAEIIAAKDTEIERQKRLTKTSEDFLYEVSRKLGNAEAKLAQYEAQEPVAYIQSCDLKWLSHDNYGSISITTTKSTTHTEPLYTSPATDLKEENERLREALHECADAISLHGEMYPHMTKGYTEDALRNARAAINVEAFHDKG